MNPLFDASAVKDELKRRAGEVEAYGRAFGELFPGSPERLASSMRYSLRAGGKRIRPALCLASASLFGLGSRAVLPFAWAVEMIHTYSLIHDDLPAMDDDDLRRGRPSNHVAFDEATAILAGDGLLTDAFIFMARAEVSAERRLAAITEFARAAGSAGMVGGQSLDMIYTSRKRASREEVTRMQALKTGAIIRACCVCGAILAGAGEEDAAKLGEYGAAFGRAFQIADDILDVVGDTSELGKPAHSDEAADKPTWPSTCGLEESRAAALAEAARARAALDGFTGPDADFLRNLAEYAVRRSA